MTASGASPGATPGTSEDRRRLRAGLGWILAGVVALAGFHAVGATFWSGYQLRLGSTLAPFPLHSVFLLNLVVLGGAAAFCLAFGASTWLAVRSGAPSGAGLSGPGSDRLWCALGAAAVFALAAVLRSGVLLDGPLTDDESAYQFNAELLASGRLFVDSPEAKLFYDRAFMINGGRLYGQYFLGWSALMVPGVWLGAPGYMNAFYAALAVPPLFFVLRRWLGPGWARLGVVLYVASPMLMLGAATQLSHPSCLCALAWATWLALRAADDDAPLWTHAAFATAFGVAFFIRPSSAVGLGLPLLVVWTRAALAGGAAPAFRRLAAFAAPALVLAGLFLGANQLQNGSPLQTGYQEGQEYVRENGGRFANAIDETTTQPWFRFGEPPERQLAKVVTGLTRLHFALLGWPLMLLLVGFAIGGPRLPWWMLASFALLHAPIDDLGVDSFAPVHWYEPAWPLLLLVVIGTARATRLLGRLPLAGRPGAAAWLPTGFALASILVALFSYVPVRFGTVARIAENVTAPERAAAASGLGRAVVFAPVPFAPNCLSAPTHHFVYWRPNNDPDQRNDVLWLNHLGLEADREMMRRFPDRRGYVMLWQRPCSPQFHALEDLEPGQVPEPDLALVPAGGRGATP